MSDLISRSALIKKLESMSSDNDVRNNSHQFTYKELVYIICNQPTAYDVEKVVAELKKYKSTIYSEAGECWEQYVYLDTAQKIARKGGVE